MASVSALLSSRWLLLIAVLTLTGVQPVRAQDDEEKAVNLSNCLSRKNLHKCKKGWLTPQDLLRVDEIERQENQRLCLTGKTPDKCDRALLSLRDIQQTIVAERRENLKNCLLGPGGDRRPCRRDWLSEPEVKRVEATGKLPPEARPVSAGLPVEPVQPTAAQTPTPQPAPFPARPERLGGPVTPPPVPTVVPPQPVFIEVPPAPPVARKESAKVAEKAAKLRAAKAAAAASASREARAARSKAASPTAARKPDSPYAHCNAEQFIETLSSEGRVAELEDGSIWIIALRDSEKVLSWETPAHVVACPTELINTENGQSVQARRQE
jgi:hypothetical protein